ncbi:MAG: response regulator transcription factor [Paludibacter sp.]|jgi:two-component system response regulator VicR|nr:response regulator transcription factor [Paludibacter sp.]
MYKVLLIEDDLNLGTTLRGALEERAYSVKYLPGGATALKELISFKPDIVLLDVNLNEELDGFAISRKIRELSDVPLLFTTSRDENSDFDQAFSIPNTDYVRKPYRLAEVLKRIEKLVVKEAAVQCFEIGNLRFYPDQHKLVVDGEELYLNNYASEVLMLLCKNKDNFVSRDTIIETVWKTRDTRLKEGSLNNNVTVLRKYLERDPSLTLESKIKLGLRLRTE